MAEVIHRSRQIEKKEQLVDACSGFSICSCSDCRRNCGVEGIMEIESIIG